MLSVQQKLEKWLAGTHNLRSRDLSAWVEPHFSKKMWEEPIWNRVTPLSYLHQEVLALPTNVTINDLERRRQLVFIHSLLVPNPLNPSWRDSLHNKECILPAFKTFGTQMLNVWKDVKKVQIEANMLIADISGYYPFHPPAVEFQQLEEDIRGYYDSETHKIVTNYSLGPERSIPNIIHEFSHCVDHHIPTNTPIGQVIDIEKELVSITSEWIPDTKLSKENVAVLNAVKSLFYTGSFNELGADALKLEFMPEIKTLLNFKSVTHQIKPYFKKIPELD